MLGTAPRADAWLMLEFNGLWERKALETNALLPAVQNWLDRAVASLSTEYEHVRPQFIKQRRSEDGCITFMFCAEGELRRKDVASYDELVEWQFNPQEMSTVEAPQYFVCTNGRRDRCCSKLGLPCYRALRTLVGRRVWETTHTGGHRFAPNVVSLPQGVVYGRVLPEELVEFVATVDGGDLSISHLRGRSAYPPAAQVAEVQVADARALTAVEGELVTFDTSDGPQAVRVQRAERPIEVMPSCGKDLEEVLHFR